MSSNLMELLAKGNKQTSGSYVLYDPFYAMPYGYIDRTIPWFIVDI